MGNVGGSYLGGCEEFITTERPTAPIHRSTLVRVVCLFK